MTPGEAEAKLKAHNCSDKAILDSMVSPIEFAGEQLTSDELLEEARQRTKEVNLGAWDTVESLEQLATALVVDDEEFNATREVASHARPAIQAAWLQQWQRPEVWLAALGDFRYPEDFPDLVAAVLDLDPLPGQEALAALLTRALQAADKCAFEEKRQNWTAEPSATEGPPWNQVKWPDLAELLADNLISSGEPGRGLAREMLALCGITRNSPRDPTIAWHWHVALAKRIPEPDFEYLLTRSKESQDRFALSALEGAALTAVCQLAEPTEWASRVLLAYENMPCANWAGWGLPPIALEQTSNLLGLLGVCLATQPDPVERWSAIWRMRYPGAPEGWKVNAVEWSECSQATAHLEWAGLNASLQPKTEGDGLTHTYTPLFEIVRDALHQRLIAAAGSYHYVDGSLLHILWAIGGEEAMASSWQAIGDSWMTERLQSFDSGKIHFGEFFQENDL